MLSELELKAYSREWGNPSFATGMRIQKLDQIILQDGELDEAGRSKNADAFAEIVQCLDDRSLCLVMREAKDDGRAALKILREHYCSKGKPRIVALYTELTSLQKSKTESVTDYLLRAENAATSLKTSGETISDSLLVAMLLKGLPIEFKSFSTVVTQKEKAPTFPEFKVALRSYEETEKLWNGEGDRVMKVNAKSGDRTIKCYSCGKPGHKSSECWSKQKKHEKRWCELCKSSSHNTFKCRKRKKESRDSVKCAADGTEHTFDILFKAADVDDIEGDHAKGLLLVDCGATAHIIRDESKFVSYDNTFCPQNHFIELANGEGKSVALKRGKAVVNVIDSEGKSRKAVLDNALLVPSYPQDIFSVQAAAQEGATITFNPGGAELVSNKGVLFNINKMGKLYYLNTHDSCSSVDSVNVTRDLEGWHKVLGHCNVSDVMKLERVVEGMKIAGKHKFDCEACIRGKMTECRNRSPDERAVDPLELVHYDLAGPVDPIAKGDYRYALNFIHDYSGLMMVYFLKKKSDTVEATKKFFADVAPLGRVKSIVESTPISSVKCVRSDNGGEFTSKEFRDLLLSHNVKHEKSAPYSPHQNGTAERAWRSIFEMARCLLVMSELPKFMWTYAVMASTYIRNRCYNPRLEKTPMEAFSGRKPNISHMHVFGSVCYALVQSPKKLDARAQEGVFVGYDRGSPAYLVYFPENQEVTQSNNSITITTTLKSI